MTAPRLLLIVPKLSYRTDDFLAAASKLGVELVLASDRCHVLAEEWPAGAIPVEFARPDEAVDELVQAASARQVTAVLGVDDLTSELAARAGERLGLSQNPPFAAQRARVKKLQRETLTRAGVAVPRFRVVHLDDDALALARWVGFPCVVKPTALSGSRGVMRADDEVEFPRIFGRLRALLRCGDVRSRRDASLDEVLIEEFVPGFEHALEGLLENGQLRVLALFDKPDPLDGPYFEETIYVTPSRLSEKTQQQIAATIARACEALGLREGPIHAEVRVNERGVFVLEVAARTIGGLCSRTLRFGAGLTLEEVVIAHAAKLPLPSSERERRAAGVMMIPIPRAGAYRSMRGGDEARAVRGIEDLVISVPLGTHLVPLPEGAGYFGFLFARGETPAEVEASLRAAHACLSFEIEPSLPVVAAGVD